MKEDGDICSLPLQHWHFHGKKEGESDGKWGQIHVVQSTLKEVTFAWAVFGEIACLKSDRQHFQGVKVVFFSKKRRHFFSKKKRNFWEREKKIFFSRFFSVPLFSHLKGVNDDLFPILFLPRRKRNLRKSLLKEREREKLSPYPLSLGGRCGWDPFTPGGEEEGRKIGQTNASAQKRGERGMGNKLFGNAKRLEEKNVAFS